MPIEAVKIPQNVYVEDRIVGPLTLRQVMIVAIGVGGSYALWSSLLKSFGGRLDPVTTVLAWMPAVLSLAFAFIKINDLSLMKLLLLRLEHSQKPSVRTWGPRAGISITVKTFTTAEPTHKPITNAELDEKRHRLEELSNVLSTEPPVPTATPDDDIPEPVVMIPAGSTGTPQPPAAPPPVDQGRVTVDPATGEAVDGIRVRSSMYSAPSNG